MNRTLLAVIAFGLAGLGASVVARPASLAADAGQEDVQTQFAEAYNRKDAAAMAALFTDDAIRITPSGLFQGRDAIRRSMQDVLDSGLHDYTVRRTVTRSEGPLVFNAGEWQAKLGSVALRGYYSAILVTQGGQVKILAETVNVAPVTRK